MAKYSIGTLNNISKVGLDRLTDQYALTEDINEANGIVVRSYKMHEMDFSDNLLAIGRAAPALTTFLWIAVPMKHRCIQHTGRKFQRS